LSILVTLFPPPLLLSLPLLLLLLLLLFLLLSYPFYYLPLSIPPVGFLDRTARYSIFINPPAGEAAREVS